MFLRYGQAGEGVGFRCARGRVAMTAFSRSHQPQNQRVGENKTKPILPLRRWKGKSSSRVRLLMRESSRGCRSFFVREVQRDPTFGGGVLFWRALPTTFTKARHLANKRFIDGTQNDERRPNEKRKVTNEVYSSKH